ncbi:MAG TPA: DUF1080 domain-containing protein [Cyclobacteriaceae bacterium]|nr:DUF1080 domain-containing protein [Cyclobacteriaceae bacterium]
MKNNHFLILTFASIVTFSCTSPIKKETGFRPLFNGENIQGWETYIGIPGPGIEINGFVRDSSGMYTEPIGLNYDPLSIFTVVTEDGEPAVRVSGQVNGALATIEEFGNYHFRMQVKWGEKKWGSNLEMPRNSGLLYHGTGEYGRGLGVWKTSHECQVMETMFGDSYRMGDSYCSIYASKPEGSERYVYNPAGSLLEVGEGREAGKIVSKSVMAEKPYGEWNTVEIICFEGKAIHIINGRVNMVIENSHLFLDGRELPLMRGNIQLQSEGSEVYFRKMEIRGISEIPAKYL